MSQKVEALRQLVASTIASEPFEFEGFQWCALSQPDMAAKLGFSISTINRLIAKPPFVRDTVQIKRRIVTLIREGVAGPMTPRHIANVMASLWRKRFERAATNDEWGCMLGLAQKWPTGHQIEIFKDVIREQSWPEFMAGVQIEIAKISGKHGKFAHPTMSVIRRFADVAVEYHVMKLQEAGNMKPKPISLKPGPNPALEAMKAK